jgi:hypothetical protein
MGDGQSSAAREATYQNLDLSNQLFGLAKQGLTAGTDYLSSAYNMGGMIDLNPKYQAMQTQFMDKTGGAEGSFRDPSQMGKIEAGRAAGLSGIASEQIGEKFDIMNSIRSMLAGQGLKTTGMAAAAEGLSVDAISRMAPNQTGAYIKGGAALASAGYGAGRDAGWWGQANPSLSGAWNYPSSFVGGAGGR